MCAQQFRYLYFIFYLTHFDDYFFYKMHLEFQSVSVFHNKKRYLVDYKSERKNINPGAKECIEQSKLCLIFLEVVNEFIPDCDHFVCPLRHRKVLTLGRAFPEPSWVEKRERRRQF